jgi:membrane associated rhomboid family serine protease
MGKQGFRKFQIPTYNRNAVIQLVAANGVGFVAVKLVWITLIIYAVPIPRAHELTFDYIGIANLAVIKERWWTVLSYGWCHRGFWEWLSNMLWLYCFGSVVQSLIGYKQIIPLFVYGIILGGLAFAGVQLIPMALLPVGTLVMGAQAGIMALMAAAITLSPKYRVYLSDYFSIPLMFLAALFVALMLLNTAMNIASITMLLAGAFMGFVYIKILQAGYKPGEWVYRFYDKMDTALTPSEQINKHRNRNAVLQANGSSKVVTSQQKIDQLLDKINQKGYDGLTAEEKELLKKASE